MTQTKISRARESILLGLLCLLCLSACRPDKGGDLEDIPYQPETYSPYLPANFPILESPADNPLTVEGVQLGRRLFYDPLLSADGSMSCASCHQIDLGFADGLATSTGIDGINGRRSAMSLLNVGLFYNGLAWDGAHVSLEAQALEPVTNPVELHEDWGNVEEKLRNHADYPSRFRKAFGIKDSEEITRELAVRALAQFERVIISGGNAKADQVLRGEPGVFFTDAEFNGYEMFFDLSFETPDAECAHCHGGPLYTTNEYFNNGLTEAQNLNDFPDLGRGAVTDYEFDNGKFRAPSLRNIALTAPYMHDGRFETLEEVVAHYNSGGHYAENRSPLIYPLNLTEQQQQDLVSFLHTLTDTTFADRGVLTNPF